MTTHGERRTRSRVYVVIAILVVGYVIYDKVMERYKHAGEYGQTGKYLKEAKLKRIEEKEKIKVAPEWRLNNLAGGVFDSEYLKGDVALITFWSSGCSVCRSEIPMMRDLDAKYKDKGFRIVAIALDDHEDEDLRAFVIGERIKYIVLRGNAKVTKAFGEIEVVPQSFLIDRKGNVIKYFLGKINEKEIEPLIEGALDFEKDKSGE